MQKQKYFEQMILFFGKSTAYLCTWHKENKTGAFRKQAKFLQW